MKSIAQKNGSKAVRERCGCRSLRGGTRMLAVRIISALLSQKCGVLSLCRDLYDCV